MKNQMVKRLLKKAVAISLAAVVTATAVTSGSLMVAAAEENDFSAADAVNNDGGDSGAAETASAETTPEGSASAETVPAESTSAETDAEEKDEVISGEQDTTVTVKDTLDQLDTAESAAGDVVESLPFGDVKEKEEEVIEAENDVESSVKAAEDIIKDAEAKIDKETESDMETGADQEGLLDKETEDGGIVPGTTEKNTDEANKNIDDAENTMDTAQGNFDAALEDAQSKIDMGFTSSTEAQEVLNNLAQAQEEAKAEFDKAQGSMIDAKENLDQAQAAYDEAKLISDEAAKEAAKALEEAKIKMQEAVEAADAANKRVQKVQGILADASGYLESWKEDVDSALENVEEKLEESRKDLEDAIENLETESEELKEAAADFRDQFDSFIDATKDFTGSIKDAVNKQEKLDELYRQYEDLKAAKEAAQAAYDELGGDAAKAELDEQFEALDAALKEAEAALENAEAAKNAYEIGDETGYVENLQNKKDILFDEERSQEEKEAAAKELAELVIRNELAGNAEGREVIWVNKDGEGSNGKSGYGKSSEGFYAVLETQEDGSEKIVKRYGFTVNTEEGENKGSLNICEMEGKNTTNYIVVGETDYVITVQDDGSMSIEMDGTEVPVYKDCDENGDVFYYTKKTSEGNNAIEKVDDTSRPSVMSLKILKWTYEVKEDDKGLYIEKKLDPSKKRLYLSKGADGKWYYEDEGKKYKIGVESYDQKEVIQFEGETYDLLRDEDKDNQYYIIKDGITVRIFKDDTGETYTYGYTLGPEASSGTDTTYDYTEGGYSSDTYLKIYQEYIAEKEKQEKLLEEYEAAESKWQEMLEKYNDLERAEEEFEEGDLNTLANLPKNIGDVVGNVEMDDIKDIADLVKKIDDIKNTSGTDKLASIIELLKSAENIGGILPQGVDIQELIINLTFENDPPKVPVIGSEAVPGGEKWSPAKHEYAVAWLDALKAKVEVVNKGGDLVKATNATVISGIELIKAGADVDDALLDAMIEGVKIGILAGAAGSLTFAGDVLETANKLVEELEGKVGVLQAETQKAYDEAVKAQILLEDLMLKNPKEDELNAAVKALEEAWARYHDLNGRLEDAKGSLKDAEDYKKTAQEEYDRLREIENRQPGTTDGNTAGGTTGGNAGGTSGRTEGSSGAGTAGEMTIVGMDAAEIPAVAALMNAGTFAANAAPVLTASVNVPEEAEEAEAAVIGDEETPLAAGEEINGGRKEFTVADEEVPLANIEVVCHLQWLILLMTIAFATYNAVRVYFRKKEAEE